MAQRRMFSLQIVDTDAFLDMPQGSQLLYFHLSMRADDDGFVSNPKKVMRFINANEDDYKILVAKNFIIPFETGVCVIKHWLVHNLIRFDRYKETSYGELKARLDVKENGSYTLATKRQPDDNQLATQDRIGKDRLGKENSTPIGLVEELPEGIDKVSWDMWIEYRKEIRKALKPRSIAMQLKFLLENKSDQKAIIEKSISNGWTGLFPLQGQSTKKVENVHINKDADLVSKMKITKAKS